MTLQPAPLNWGKPLRDDGGWTEVYARYWNDQRNLLANGVGAASFWIGTSNGLLPDAANIGALTTGYVKATVAFGVATPSTVAQIPGSDVAHDVVSKVFANSGYVATSDQTVLVDATAGATTIKAPATATKGVRFLVKKTDASGNAVTIDGNGHNIDGAASQALAAQNNSLTIEGDGSLWWVIGRVA